MTCKIHHNSQTTSKVHKINLTKKGTLAFLAMTLIISGAFVPQSIEAISSDQSSSKILQTEIKAFMDDEISRLIAGTPAEWENKDQVKITKSTVPESIHFDFKLKVDIPVWWDPHAHVNGDLKFSCDQRNKEITIEAINIRQKVDSRWYSEVLSFGIVEIIDHKFSNTLKTNLEFKQLIPINLEMCPRVTIHDNGDVELDIPVTSIQIEKENQIKVTKKIGSDVYEYKYGYNIFSKIFNDLKEGAWSPP